MNYAALNTKISAIYAKTIKTDIALEMLEKSKRTEAIDVLNTRLGLTLDKNAELYDVNLVLESAFFNKLKSLLHYMSGADRKFYELILERYTIRDIKRVLRTIVHAHDPEGLKETLLGLDPDKVPTKDEFTVEAFIKKLQGTVYARPLIVYKDMGQDEMLFYMEMTLDKIYYDSLHRAFDDLSTKSVRYAKDLIEQHIDLLNLKYMIRAKRTYHVIPEALINFLLEGGTLSYKKLKAMALLDQETFEEKLKQSRHAHLLEGRVENIDIKLARELYANCQTVYGKSGFDMGKLISLTLLFELTARDISTVLQGQSLGFFSGRIRELIAIPIKEGEVWQ
ncbi:V-type ATPase subunit [Peptoniphilus equinus]|uniref:V-type ATPase subunit n=1 Tax=Peptoniphilus equinus TaxID=3016343 RepID=A0ABY7QUK7_9FIRM|nr:V-type ATPase subunit [Peptoniphilus equinus]WBW49769.1 V-type ATPase subunit [Peptoniphilus equinus]